MSTREFHHATKVIFGRGSVGNVGREAKALGAQKVLIVTDSFLADSQIMDKVTQSLKGEGISYILYRDVKPNPRDGDCLITAKLAEKEKADVLIGVGGGSCMDQAKAAAAIMTNGGTCQDWDGIDLRQPMKPVICIPTTSGTGSEVTFVAVITDPVRKFKMTLMDGRRLVPSVAIADPELTLSLPPSLTASTGIDALTHGIEAYTCKVSQPITDGLALHAIEMISQNIVKAVQEGSNIDARSNMMIASLMAGMAFINSNVGAVHAISETLGGWYDTPHGVGNSIFLPHIMKYNLQGNEKRLGTVARYLGIDPQGKSDLELALSGINRVKELNDLTGIPRLRDLSYIKEENFEAIAKASAENILSADNGREIGKEGYLQVLREAYHYVRLP